jgi:uncharacterized membrane protein YagU involved in acid resistance
MACAISGAPPALILRAIASGIRGASAYHDGTWVAALGLVLQWTMSIFIAGMYLILGAWAPSLVRRWIVSGVLYGVIVFVVMNLVVVPLSAATPKPHATPILVIENFAAMLIFGMIIAYLAHRSERGNAASLRGAQIGGEKCRAASVRHGTH